MGNSEVMNDTALSVREADELMNRAYESQKALAEFDQAQVDKIVEAMAKEGLTKDMLGRDKFLERAWEWKKVYGGRIVEQLKKLGSSCDWDRERFTMDEGLSEAVKEVFVRLYKKGLSAKYSWNALRPSSINNQQENKLSVTI
jgi:hypothetical protein